MQEIQQNSLPPEELIIPDFQIILASKENPERFGEIVNRYQDLVSGFFNKRIQDVEDSEDLAQATWTSAFVGLQNYQDQGVPFGAWLVTIARNRWANWVRFRQMHPMFSLSLAEDKSSDESPENDVIKAEERAKVRRVLGQMPVDQRYALWAHVVDDEKFRDIGDWMGRTEGAVKSLVNRAKESFKNRYLGTEEAF